MILNKFIFKKIMYKSIFNKIMYRVYFYFYCIFIINTFLLYWIFYFIFTTDLFVSLIHVMLMRLYGCDYIFVEIRTHNIYVIFFKIFYIIWLKVNRYVFSENIMFSIKKGYSFTKKRPLNISNYEFFLYIFKFMYLILIFRLFKKFKFEIKDLTIFLFKVSYKHFWLLFRIFFWIILVFTIILIA